MFKRIVLGLAVLAIAATALAFGVPRFSSTTGNRVLYNSKCNVERIFVSSSAGTVTIGVYNATSATGAVAINLVAEIPVTAATLNLEVPIFGNFTRGLVIGSGATSTAVYATVQPSN